MIVSHYFFYADIKQAKRAFLINLKLIAMSTAPAKPIKAEPASLILNTNPGLIIIRSSISIREFTGRKKFFMARCCMIEIPIILAKIIKNSDPPRYSISIR